jgi:hypothetical protein
LIERIGRQPNILKVAIPFQNHGSQFLFFYFRTTMATPNSSEDSLQCAKLLELVKTVSELQNSGALQNLDDSDSYLTQLERTASGIRDILTHLQTSQKQQSVAAIPVNPALIGSNSSSAQLPATQQPQQLNEIYQNLGPLMGSGLRSSPALPPRQHGNN